LEPGAWSLELGAWSLELGVLSFELGAWSFELVQNRLQISPTPPFFKPCYL